MSKNNSSKNSNKLDNKKQDTEQLSDTLSAQNADIEKYIKSKEKGRGKSWKNKVKVLHL